jgi:hypothetical protein
LTNDPLLYNNPLKLENAFIRFFLQNTETRLGGAEERIKERIYALWGTVDTGSDETNKK